MVSRSLANFKEEVNRNVKLTSVISITTAIILFVVGLLYTVGDIEETDRLSYLMIGASFIFIIPFIMNKRGHSTSSRLLLSSLLPVFIMIFSIDSKIEVISMDIINPVNYFDVRIALINALVVPIVIFSLKERELLYVALVPSFISIMLFDPIHEYFEVGYYDAGMVSKDYYFSANLYSLITVIFLTVIMLFLKNEVLKGDFKQINENTKIKLYLSKLVDLSSSHNINFGKLEEAKKEVLAVAKSCLEISRVSLWVFDNQKDAIECEYLLDENGLKNSNSSLNAKDYPIYFEAIKNQQLIIATDARSNANTQEFTENYLNQHNIYSMMDAAFLSKGEFGGVICCEQQEEVKEWDAAESLLLKALGDFLSYTMIVKDRIHQNNLLKVKNDEILKMNLGLESLVQERTKELEKKNEQLTEYAYINSHILKAPVARVSGLYNLFKIENSNQLNKEVAEHMDSSIEELELITLRINRAIEDHGNIDREQLLN